MYACVSIRGVFWCDGKFSNIKSLVSYRSQWGLPVVQNTEGHRKGTISCTIYIQCIIHIELSTPPSRQGVGEGASEGKRSHDDKRASPQVAIYCTSAILN